jgi:hypothetical protein
MPIIYATGFNAHNQIIASRQSTEDTPPEDVKAWTEIAKAEAKAGVLLLGGGKVGVLFAGWSSTVCKFQAIPNFKTCVSSRMSIANYSS